MLLIFIIIIILISLYFSYIFGATKRTKKLLKKYSKVKNSAGLTGADFLNASFGYLGFNECEIQYSDDENYNCYIPKHKLIVLYNDYCFKPTLSALGVASHELGHCIQHHKKNFIYVLTKIFQIISRIASLLIIPSIVVFIFFLSSSQFVNAEYALTATLILLIASVLFKLLLIPCEINASKIGINFLKKHQLIKFSEEREIRKILKAAANTYIADFYRTFMKKH